jgi:hypothetical protein
MVLRAEVQLDEDTCITYTELEDTLIDCANLLRVVLGYG